MPIFNCHIHLFSRYHLPPNYPRFPANVIRRVAPRLLIWFLRKFLPSRRDFFHRFADFGEAADGASQDELFRAIRQHYPLSTRFVVLPMDLRGMELGTPPQTIREQHEELAALVEAYPENIIPFIHIDPRSASRFGGEEPVDFIREFHREWGFRGIKLYPPLGYAADDPSLEPIYAYAHEHRLPVMTHCSRSGIRAKGLDATRAQEYSAPHRYRRILEKYPNMRLCLAHFGGQGDWESYLEDPWLEDSTDLEQMDWLSQVSTMIRCGRYPNLYTDISYTIFYTDRFIPLLKVMLHHEALRQRVLFGSDYYMILQEKMTERELSIHLRAHLGENFFWQVAEENPKHYLGIDDSIRALDEP